MQGQQSLIMHMADTCLLHLQMSQPCMQKVFGGKHSMAGNNTAFKGTSGSFVLCAMLFVDLCRHGQRLEV